MGSRKLEGPLLGAKVRVLRRKQEMSQAALADKLSISASYLNLIENNRRPLTAPLLIRLAQIFQVDLQVFATSDDSRLVSDLVEAFGDPMFDHHLLSTTDLREFATSSPHVARAVLSMYSAFAESRAQVATLSERLSEGERVAGIVPAGLPSEEVSDFIERRGNFFPELEERAEALWQKAELSADDVYGGLLRFMQSAHRTRVELLKAGEGGKTMRHYDPRTRVIALSELLPPRSRRFQLGYQVGLITQSDVIDQLTQDEALTTPQARALGRVALANYFAACLYMPYRPFLEAARSERYDVELLGHRFGTSFEQVCHRLTSLRRPGFEGVPFHFLRIDIAGNISKRFSGSGIQIARYSGACPRWNVHAALLTPGMIRVQISQMPDGSRYFCIARTVRSDRGGYHMPHTVHAIGLGCDVRYARALVYADGVDVDSADAAVPVGVTCRACERLDCEQRAFPPIQHPLQIHENVRGVSFYAPPVEGALDGLSAAGGMSAMSATDKSHGKKSAPDR